jgi:adenylate kinase
MNVIITGPQGSGKGTMAKKIAEKYGVQHISTGDIFRQHIKEETSLGQQIESIMKEGKLVPDSLTNAVVKETLSKIGEGYILDGYPRNLEQAKFLHKIAKLDLVLYLEITDEEAIRRIASRRTCNSCGAVYNVITQKPQKEGSCDKCQGRLVQRADDTPEAIKERLDTYHQHSTPLLDYYRNEGILIEIEGSGTVDAVFEEISAEIEDNISYIR